MKEFDLKLWRAKHGLTQEQAAEKILVSLRTIQRIEADDYSGPYHLIRMFCEGHDLWLKNNKECRLTLPPYWRKLFSNGEKK